MDKLNFGTGLASLLTGIAKGETHNLQQDYALQQREAKQMRMRELSRQEKSEDAEANRTRQDQEQSLAIQKRIQTVQGAYSKLRSLQSDVLGGKKSLIDARQEASQHDQENGTGIANDFDQWGSAIQQEPTLTQSDGTEAENPLYVATYKPTVIRTEGHPEANQNREIETDVDPKTGKRKPGAVERVAKTYPLREKNPNNAGYSPYQLPKTTEKQLSTYRKQYTDALDNANIVSKYLSTNSQGNKLVDQEAQRIQTEQDDNGISPNDKDYMNQDQIRQKAIENVSNIGWNKEAEMRTHFNQFLDPIIATHEQADSFVADHENDDKDAYQKAAIDTYKKGDLDAYGLFLVSQKSLGKYRELINPNRYNESQQEDMPVQKKSQSTPKTEKKTITKKPVKGKLDKETAREYYQKAGGDKNKAMQMAKDDGYEF
jgi:hypothetical protein